MAWLQVEDPSHAGTSHKHMRGVFVIAIIVLAQIGLGPSVAGATDGAQINAEGTEGLNKLLAWSIGRSNAVSSPSLAENLCVKYKL